MRSTVDHRSGLLPSARMGRIVRRVPTTPVKFRSVSARRVKQYLPPVLGSVSERGSNGGADAMPGVAPCTSPPTGDRVHARELALYAQLCSPRPRVTIKRGSGR